MKMISKPLAKTNAERIAAFRRRRAAVGLTEVRGIFALEPHHAMIKRYAQGLGKTGGRGLAGANGLNSK